MNSTMEDACSCYCLLAAPGSRFSAWFLVVQDCLLRRRPSINGKCSCSVEQLEDLLAAEWARVPQLTTLHALQGLANLSSDSKVILGGGGRGLSDEAGQDDVILGLWLGSGGQVADETAVASLWFPGGKVSKDQLLFVDFVSTSLDLDASFAEGAR